MTLLEGDHIQFNISTDRRDKLERATNIDILPDSFDFTKETREMVRIEEKCAVVNHVTQHISGERKVTMMWTVTCPSSSRG